MIDLTLVSFVSALTALVASIAGPLVTLYVARSQFRVNVRSVINPLEHEHQKLIEVMNGLLARFLTASAEDELQSEGQKIVG